MERNPHNFDDFSGDFDPNARHETGGSHDPGFTGNDGPQFSSDGAKAGSEPSEVGPEWFDPRWLRANGAAFNEDGDIHRVGSPVLVLISGPTDLAPRGEEIDEALRVVGMLAWGRRRPVMAGTLLQQMQRATIAKREWLERNPFAVFWSATARTGPRRHRGSARRP